MQKPRTIVRLEMDAASKRNIDMMCEKQGMTHVSIISRLVNWFASEPEIIQAAILGRYPKKIDAQLDKLILTHIRDRNPLSNGE